VEEKKGKGNLGGVNTIKGDAKNQDQIGWSIGEVQGFGSCIC
jgi:hypothetical protein